MTRRPSLPVLCCALALGACAAEEPKWVHPTLPAEQWQADTASCLRQARRKAESGLADDAAAGALEAGAQDMTVRAQLLRDRDKDARMLAARCMAALGYRRAER